MSYPTIKGLSVLCLFGTMACAKSEAETPLTPAARSTPPSIAEMSQPAPATTRSEPRSQTPANTETADRSAIASSERSSTSIATARCEREERCKNADRDGTREDCIVSLEPAI